MTVGKLKELLAGVPDDAPVICFDKDSEGFYPCEDTSGFAEWSEPCDEHGNQVDDNVHVPPMFILMHPDYIEVKNNSE